MTGLLAVSGVIIVLLASAYSGLTAPETGTTLTPGFEITPVTDLDTDDDADGDEADSEAQPEATDTPEPEAPPPAPTQVLNRLNCDQIRGTDYFSPEERTWFLANCVN